MGKFFLDSDFKAFDRKFARSTDEKIIANRMITVNKFRDLHEQGLKKIMNSNELHAHWQKQHLTNVVWPLKQANGEYVDYVRIGYGKSKQEIKELSQILSLFSINDKGYMKDDMAFHYVTQLQLSINEDEWNVALYLGHHGWLEQKNLVNKVKNNKKEKDLLKDTLNFLQDKGYILYIYSELGDYYYEDASEYINEIIDYSNKGVSFTIHICKELDKDDEKNDIQKILPYLITEFKILMPIYKFIAWDSKKNNYL